MKAGVPKTRLEVKDLERLRQLFLNAPEHSGVADYWSDSGLLKLYDATFARRISWKWQAVLDALLLKGWQPPKATGRWIDWGCGSGVASEMLARAFPASKPPTCIVSDRSVHAQKFAAEKLKQLLSETQVIQAFPDNLEVQKNDLVLLSHVLTELSEQQLTSLLNALKPAHTILWVEPGTPFCSNRLVALREALRADFNVVAPCPHQSICGLQGDERNWCHFFAAPPSDIFQDSDWMHFSREMKIDLRSLPLSYLLLEKKSANAAAPAQAPVSRVIGRPRFYKGHAKMLVCNVQGVNEITLQERNHKSEFKTWKNDPFLIELTNALDSD
jgi:ribosomal protein RSM22 (predicted rRNA methylase)